MHLNLMKIETMLKYNIVIWVTTKEYFERAIADQMVCGYFLFFIPFVNNIDPTINNAIPNIEGTILKIKSPGLFIHANPLFKDGWPGVSIIVIQVCEVFWLLYIDTPYVMPKMPNNIKIFPPVILSVPTPFLDTSFGSFYYYQRR